MKKRFQGIVNFSDERICSSIKMKANEAIVINLILRMTNKEPLNLSSHKINLFVSSKTNSNDIYYSNSMVKIVNAERGLIQCEIPSFTFEKGKYLGAIEVLDLEEKNFLSTNCLEFDVDFALGNNRNIDTLAPKEKIETLQQLDMYVTRALERLQELEERMGDR